MICEPAKVPCRPPSPSLCNPKDPEIPLKVIQSGPLRCTSSFSGYDHSWFAFPCSPPSRPAPSLLYAIFNGERTRRPPAPATAPSQENLCKKTRRILPVNELWGGCLDVSRKLQRKRNPPLTRHALISTFIQQPATATPLPSPNYPYIYLFIHHHHPVLIPTVLNTVYTHTETYIYNI